MMYHVHFSFTNTIKPGERFTYCVRVKDTVGRTAISEAHELSEGWQRSVRLSTHTLVHCCMLLIMLTVLVSPHITCTHGAPIITIALFMVIHECFACATHGI